MGKFLLLFEGTVFLGALGIPGSLQHKVELEIRQAQASRIWQKILRQESLVETHISCSPQNCLGTGMLHQLWIPSWGPQFLNQRLIILFLCYWCSYPCPKLKEKWRRSYLKLPFILLIDSGPYLFSRKTLWTKDKASVLLIFHFFLSWESCAFDPPRNSQRWFSLVVLKFLEIFWRPFRARRMLVLPQGFLEFSCSLLAWYWRRAATCQHEPEIQPPYFTKRNTEVHGPEGT